MATEIPTLKVKNGDKVAPGDRIGSGKQILPGPGTYLRGGHVFASTVGVLTLTKDTTNQKPMYIAGVELESGKYKVQNLFVEQVIMGKIARVMAQQVIVEIVAADGIGLLREHSGGVIRKEDVRSSVSEEVDMYASFQPGDIILARITSLGDSRRYYLSTAENQLGVIRAVSRSSKKVMVPISWKEMECPETKVREPRKCAKPREV
jgi:exosome complex component CSL4